MSINFTGGSAQSINNFTWPASGKLLLMMNVTLGTLPVSGAGITLVSDQVSFAAKHQKIHIKVFPFDVGQYSLSVVTEDNTGALHHYEPSDLISSLTGPQVFGIFIDASSGTLPATAKVLMNKTQLTTADNLGGGGSVNSNTNKLVIGSNNAGENPFNGKIEWVHVRDEWIGDAAYNAICDSVSSGTFTNPLDYLGADSLNHWRCVASSGQILDVVGGNHATLSGSYTSSAAFSTGVVDRTAIVLTAVADSCIKKSSATVNVGLDPLMNLRANAAGTVASRLALAWSGLSGLPAGYSNLYAPLRLNCAAVTTASAQQINARRFTEVIAEGTGTESVPGTDGITFTNRITGVAHAVLGGSFGTADLNIGNSPLAIGRCHFDLASVFTEQIGVGGDGIAYCIKRNAEITTLTNVDFDTRQGTVPPKQLLVFSLAGGGDQGSRDQLLHFLLDDDD